MNERTTPAPGPTVAVAFSGGRDSLALLHACCRAAAGLGLRVVALHVHHGLLGEADAWLAAAEALCARWRRRGWPLALRSCRLAGRPARGDSVEAWARQERHAALARMAAEEGASIVLLAQHRRDQAETVLLQALRGGGPAGLAAMPRTAERHGMVWARPWLQQPRSAIDAYIRRYRLQPVEDPSNADARFARSRLRLLVWPSLLAAFPDAEVALCAVARRAAEAAAALAELAAADMAAVCEGGALRISAWSGLSPARRVLVLRSWLGTCGSAAVPETLLQRLAAELPGRRVGRWPLAAARDLVLHRGRLGVAPALPGPVPTPMSIDLSMPGEHPVAAWQGHFVVRRTRAGGLDPMLLAQAELRPRSGGEQFQRAPGTPPRSLKKQYQAAAIAAHERGAPLVWSGGRLLYVPGLGIDARAAAPAGRPRLTLQWVLHRNS